MSRHTKHSTQHKKNTTVPSSIRQAYQEQGVHSFYLEHGKHYQNPHEPYVRALLIQAKDHIDYRSTLDLCCGSGEVTRALKELGYSETVGCDPFTYEQYKAQTGQVCVRHTFSDLIRGRLQGEFSSIICSFAMHLCPVEDLYSLVSQLFAHSEQLVIITPHKRPELERLTGVELNGVECVYTQRGKRIFLKRYSMLTYGVEFKDL